MPTADRRQYTRVSFESTFEVRTAGWSDPVATGLDISLNGCRFNCGKSMSDGETVTLAFEQGFELEGNVQWCWPIEWYFQTAVHFAGISPKKQIQLKAYIEEVTGEDYQMKLKDEATRKTFGPAHCRNKRKCVENQSTPKGNPDRPMHDRGARERSL